MNLTPEHILRIIAECKGHVKSLEINGAKIKVEFLGPQQPEEPTPSTHNQGRETIPAPLDIPEEKNLNKDLFEGQTPEEAEDEALLEELHLTNPGAYEDLVALKEITNAKAKDD